MVTLKRIVTIVTLLAAFLVSAAAGHSLLVSTTSATPREEDFYPAALGSATYLISDIRVAYPFVDPVTQVSDKAMAGVMFTPQWSGDEYPGPVSCRIHLLDSAGAEVGLYEFDLDSAMATTSPSQFEPVAVSAPPTGGSGECEAGVSQTNAGYTFEGPTKIEEIGDGTSIAFTALWTDSNPGTRYCTATITLLGGPTIGLAPFTVNLPDDHEFTLSTTLKPSDIADAAITCQPPDGSSLPHPQIDRSGTKASSLRSGGQP